MTSVPTLQKACLLLSAVVSLTPVLRAADLQAGKPSYMQVSAPFFADKQTTIPGRTLKPGSYTIRVVDHIKDRYVLSVDETGGKTLATFAGLRNPAFASAIAASKPGEIFWEASSKGTATVRGFVFPDGNALEFVYPKLQAVALAKLNQNAVLAIDPESDGLKPDPKLSVEDREVVTLWMLTAVRVGTPSNSVPAIEARQFVGSPEADSTQAAATGPAPALGKLAPASQFNLAQLDALSAPHVRAAASHRLPTVLPKTASNLSVLFLISTLLLVAAAFMSFVRRMS